MSARKVLAVVALLLLVGCDPDMAAENLAAVNAYRAGYGAQPLARVAALDAKAVARAQIMADAKEISHTSEASLKYGVPRGWLRIGENVAANYPTVAAAQTGLEQSPPHRENMLYPGYNQVGIGVVARDGLVYLAQVFVAR